MGHKNKHSKMMGYNMTSLARRLMHRTQLSTLSFLFSSALLAASLPAQAANMNELHGRLSPMPVTALTVKTITGGGGFLASLSGNTLTITGQFEGMNSAATSAHVHQGPKAQPGPVAFAIEVSQSTNGSVGGEVSLTPELIEALHSESLYIQIHSEGNPAGELRGWILH
jgi:hypothetical protein